MFSKIFHKQYNNHKTHCSLVQTYTRQCRLLLNIHNTTSPLVITMLKSIVRSAYFVRGGSPFSTSIAYCAYYVVLTSRSSQRASYPLYVSNSPLIRCQRGVCKEVTAANFRFHFGPFIQYSYSYRSMSDVLPDCLDILVSKTLISDKPYCVF